MNNSPQNQVERTAGSFQEDEIDLRDLLLRLWRRKGLIALSTAIIGCGAAAYALQLTPIFRAESVVQIREQTASSTLSALTANLGGLAAIAGIPSGSGGGMRGLALSTLQSRSLLEGFIKEQNLLPVLFAEQWDLTEKKWKQVEAAKMPTLWQGVEEFKNLLRVTEDKKTGMVIVAVEWSDPKQAASWANDLIKKTNEVLREKALAEGQTTLAYLEKEAKSTPSVEIQAVAYRLIESEMQKLMVARGAQDYALKVVDAAVAPERRVRPKRSLIALGGVLLGGFAGCVVALLLAPRQEPESTAT